MGIERPAHLGTNDHQNALYLLGAGDLIGTKGREPMGGGYHSYREGYTGTGGQGMWVQVEGGTAAAGQAGLFDTLLGVTDTMLMTLFDDPWPLVRQAARATGVADFRTSRGRPRHSMDENAATNGFLCGGEGLPGCICHHRPTRWTTSRRRPLEAVLRMTLTMLDVGLGDAWWSTPLMKTPDAWRRPAVTERVMTSVCRLRPMEAHWRLEMAATEFVGIVACLGRRVPSQRLGKVLALHSAEGKFEGLLTGLGRWDPRR